MTAEFFPTTKICITQFAASCIVASLMLGCAFGIYSSVHRELPKLMNKKVSMLFAKDKQFSKFYCNYDGPHRIHDDR